MRIGGNNLEEQIIKAALTQGIWSMLSIFLIFYILKAQEKRDEKQEERERNYQEIIAQITDQLNVVDDIKNDVEEIKQHVMSK